jgi:RNA polymerase sigma factor (sigma-70 family)
LATVDRIRSEAFTDFVSEIEARLRQALTASLGPDTGREAAAEALAYGWEHWDRVGRMDNPAGYLFRVGQRWGRRLQSRGTQVFPPIEPDRLPWIEPELPEAMARLSEQQRTVVLLRFGHEWSMSEIAGLLGVSKATVQSYSERAMAKLRRKLGVER